MTRRRQRRQRPVVYFDLEMSGTAKEEIIQIGAVGSSIPRPEFSVFAYPRGKISSYVTNNIHGIQKVLNLSMCPNSNQRNQAMFYLSR